MDIHTELGRRLLLFDGGMGTMLQAAGRFVRLAYLGLV